MKLENDHVRLEPYSVDYISFFQKWRSYYGAHFFTTMYPSYDALKKGYFERYLPNVMSGKQAWWVILDPAATHHLDPIGMIGLNDIDPKNGTAEIGQMFVIEQHRNQGYMSAAIQLILELAFCHLRLNTVYLWTWEENEDAIKSYIKAGFEKTGHIPKAIFRNQNFYDKVIMSITRDRWFQDGHA